MKKRIGILLVIGIIVVGIFIYFQGTTPIKVAFIADQGLGTSSEAVLNLIKSEHANLILNQGDFDYKDNPAAWEAQTTKILGNAFPQIAVIGNHDVAKKDGYEKYITERIARNPDISCTGKLGEQSTCLYKNLLIVSTAPGLIKGSVSPYIKTALTTKGDVWKICSWHFDQTVFQAGNKANEAGWEPYTECLNAGALIANAHEHSYSRTYLIDKLNPPHVVSTSSTLTLAPGKTFVFVSGLGGESIRPQIQKSPWFAKVYTASQGANYGALFCTFNTGGNSHKAECYFKNIDGNTVDTFTIVR
jgi:hypothetical protein